MEKCLLKSLVPYVCQSFAFFFRYRSFQSPVPFVCHASPSPPYCSTLSESPTRHSPIPSESPTGRSPIPSESPTPRTNKPSESLLGALLYPLSLLLGALITQHILNPTLMTHFHLFAMTWMIVLLIRRSQRRVSIIRSSKGKVLKYYQTQLSRKSVTERVIKSRILCQRKPFSQPTLPSVLIYHLRS